MNDKELDEIASRVANALDVPEPSPLFWEHFPQRVRGAVNASPAAAPAPWWRRHALASALSLLMVGALASLGVWSTMRDAAPLAGEHGTAVEGGAPVAMDGLMIEGEDFSWQVVGAVAATAGIDAVREAGFGVAPGDSDAAIEELSETERATLVALLQAEMNGDGS